MTKIISINDARVSRQEVDTNNEEYVEQSFASNEELVELILLQPDIFTAMGRVSEINDLNGFNVLSTYDIKKIKIHYKNIRRSEETEVIFCKSNLIEESPFLSFYKSNLDNDKVYSDNSQIKFECRQSLFYKAKDFSDKNLYNKKKMFELSYQKLLSESSSFSEVFTHE